MSSPSMTMERKVWIKEVRIKNFKSYVDVAVNPLGKGVNIIVGRNGAGKSNLLKALNFALTDAWYPGKRNKDEFYPERRNAGLPSVVVTIGVAFAPDDERQITVERGMLDTGKDYFKVGREVVPIDLYALEIMSLGFPFHSRFFFINQTEAFLACDDAAVLARRMAETLPSSEFKSAILFCKDLIKTVLPGITAEIEEAKERLRSDLARKRTRNPMAKAEGLKEKIMAHDLALAMIDYQANLDVIEDLEKRFDSETLNTVRQRLKQELLNAQLNHELAVRHLESSKTVLKDKEDVTQRLDKQLVAKNQLVAEYKSRLSEIETSLAVVTAAREELERSATQQQQSPYLSSDACDTPDSNASLVTALAGNSSVDKIYVRFRKWSDELLKLLESAHKLGFDPTDTEFHYVSPRAPNWAENLDASLKKSVSLKEADDAESQLLYRKKEKTLEELSAAEGALETLKQEEVNIKQRIREACDAQTGDQTGSLENLRERRRKGFEHLMRTKHTVHLLEQERDGQWQELRMIAGGPVVEGLENFATMLKELENGTEEERELLDDYVGVVADLLEFEESCEKGMCVLAGGALWHHVVRTFDGAMKLVRKFDEKKLSGFVDFICMDAPLRNGRFIPEPNVLIRYGNMKRAKTLARGQDFLASYLFETALVCDELGVIQESLRHGQADWVKKCDWVTLNGETYAPRRASMKSAPFYRIIPTQLRKSMLLTREVLGKNEAMMERLKNELNNLLCLEKKRTEEMHEFTKKYQQLTKAANETAARIKDAEKKVELLKHQELEIACELDKSGIVWEVRAATTANLEFARDNPPNEELTEDRIKEMRKEYGKYLQRVNTAMYAVRNGRVEKFSRERGKQAQAMLAWTRDNSSSEEHKLRSSRDTAREELDDAEKQLEELRAKHAAHPAELKALAEEVTAATEALKLAEAELADGHALLDDVEADLKKTDMIEQFREAKVKAQEYVDDFVYRYSGGIEQCRRVEAMTDRLLQTSNVKTIINERKKLTDELNLLKRSFANKKIVDEVRVQAEILVAGEAKLESRTKCLKDFQDWLKMVQSLYDTIVCAWNPKFDNFLLLWRVSFRDLFEKFKARDPPIFNAELDTAYRYDEGVMLLDEAKPKITFPQADEDDDIGRSPVELSNGEKSLVTFVLVTSLFASMGVPSILLDEVDQCLSENRRRSMADAAKKLVEENNMQLLFTTFSTEIPSEIGETFFVVESPTDRVSTVREVAKDTAMTIIGRNGE